MERKRILTGDRPTGNLHLGHYVGSIRNRVRLQDEFECFFIIADLHTLTTKPDKQYIDELADNVRQMALDYLACGIDPEKSVIYLQSAVPEVCELNLFFSDLVTVPRLQRIPSIKDMAKAAHLSELPLGLLGYPVLQAADILLPRANLVPVGKDNESHVELTREIAKRFNYMYGDVFPLPEVMVSDCGSLVGTDGPGKKAERPGTSAVKGCGTASLRPFLPVAAALSEGTRQASCLSTSRSCLEQRTKSPAVSSQASRTSARSAPSPHARTAPANAGSAPLENSIRASASRSLIERDRRISSRSTAPRREPGAMGNPSDCVASRGSYTQADTPVPSPPRREGQSG